MKTLASGLKRILIRLCTDHLPNLFALVCLNLFVLLLASTTFANPSAARTFTLDGRLYNSTGMTSPLLDANVVMNVKILDPTGTCVLYEENQVTSTYSTDGYFNIKVGSDVASMKRTGSDPGHAMAHVFQNRTLITGTNSGCAGYIPLSGDGRKIRITVSPSSGAQEVLTPDIEMDSVPMAIVAESVQGLDRSRMLEMGAGQLTQSNVDSVFSNTNYPKLSSLLGGTSGDYVRISSTTGAAMPTYSGNPMTPAAGQVWLDTLTGQLKFHDGMTVQALSSGTMVGGITSLNGISTSNQVFANGMAGTAPAFNSSGTAHTLNIPMASTASVTAGLISKTDYDAFNAKLSPTLTDGYIFVGNGSNVATGVLPSGDVTMDNAGAFALASSGVAAGTYPKVQVDSKGRVIAGFTLLNTDIPGLAASHITAGTLPVARGGTGTGATPVDGQLLIGNGVDYTLSTLTGGTGVTISNAAGAITISATGSGGTVTNVSSGSGLVGGPITGAGTLSLATTGVTVGTYTKVTVDAYGRVISGSTLAAADIPDLDAGKIVSGTFATARIPDLDGSKIASGTLAVARLPSNVLLDGGNSTGAALAVGTNDLQQLQLETNNTTRVTIGTNGNVGIGTTTPGYALDVVGTVNASQLNVAGKGAVRHFNNASWAFGTGMGSITSGEYNISIGGSALGAVTSANYNTAVGHKAMQFVRGEMNVAVGGQALGGIAGANGFRNVGVGYGAGDGIDTGNNNTFVGYFAGNNVTTGSFNVIVGSAVNLTSPTSSYQLNIGNAIFGDLTSGNVTIGTISPQAKLHVTGAILAGDDATCAAGKYGAIRVNANNLQVCLASNTWSTLAASGATGTVTQVTAGAGLNGGSITTAGTISLATTGIAAGTYTKLTIDTYGRATAGSTLSASDIPDHDAAKITTGTFTAARLPSSVILDGGNSTAAAVVIGANSNQQLQFITNNTTQVTIGTNGNVGIGASPTSAKLFVEGLTRFSNTTGSLGGTVFLDNATGVSADVGPGLVFRGNATVTMGALNYGWSAASNANSYIAFSNRGSGVVAEKMRITATGAVGIGTIAPNASLHVTGAILAGDESTCDSTRYGAIRVNSNNLQVCLATNIWSTLAASGATGTVTSVVAGAGLAGGTITTTGTISLATTGIAASSYTKLTVDSYGRATAGSTLSASDIPDLDAAKITTGTLASIRLPSSVILDGGNTIASGTLKVGTNSNHPMTLRANNLDYVTLDTSGNLGIGVVPTALLHARKDQGASTIIQVQNNSAAATAAAVVGATNSSGSTIMTTLGSGFTPAGIFEPNYGALATNVSLAGLSLGTQGAGAPLKFYTASQQRAIIDGNGNFGVGTTTPNSRLQVAGAVQPGDDVAACATEKNGAIRFNGGNLQVCLSTTWTTLSTGGASGTVTSVVAGTGLTGGTITTTGTLALATTGIASGTYTKLTIDTYGRATAGSTLSATDIPDLDAAKITTGTINNARLPSNVVLDGGNTIASGTLVVGTNSNHPLALSTNGSARVAIDSSGNVGIGTTSPVVKKLEVNGEIAVGADRVNSVIKRGTLYVPHYDTSRADVGFISASSKSLENELQIGGAPGATGATSIAFSTYTNNWQTVSGATRMYINSTGSVGIGTTTPNSRLEVVGAVQPGDDVAACATEKNGAIRFNGGNLQVCLSTTWTTLSTASGMPAGATTQVQFNSSGTFGANSNLVWDNTNGRLGIGTTTPGSRLEVTGELRVGNGAAALPSLTFGSDPDTGFYRSGADTIAWSTGGNTRGTINSDGTVSFYYDISAGRVRANDGTAGVPAFYFTNATSSGMFRPAADSIGLSTAGTERMRIDSSGSVGIGTTTPNSMLQVAGAVQPGNDAASCAAAKNGAIRFNGGNLQVCLSTTWTTLSTGGGGTPAGANTQVQFNSSGTFGANSNLVWDNTNGRLGIGSANPNQRLSIEASDTNVKARLANTSSTAARSPAWEVINYSGGFAGSPRFSGVTYRGNSSSPLPVQANDQLASFEGSGASDTSYNVNTTAQILMKATQTYSASAGGSSITFKTTPDNTTTLTDRMFIGQDGRVGIGTTAPSSQLHVTGSVTGGGAVKADLTNTSTTGKGELNVGADTGWGTFTTFGSAHSDTPMRNNSLLASGYHLYLGTSQGVGTGGSGEIRFTTGGWDYTTNQRMVITSTGNVGIGTTTPQATLDVNGAIRIAGGAASCAAAQEGSLRYNSTKKVMEFCNGTGWFEVGGGPMSCPTGFTMIGTAGATGTFCIHTNEQTAGNFTTANNNCGNLATSNGANAALCTSGQWIKACVAGTPTGMTGNNEWVADVSYDGTNFWGARRGSTDCTSWGASTEGNSLTYRCCVQ